MFAFEALVFSLPGKVEITVQPDLHDVFFSLYQAFSVAREDVEHFMFFGLRARPFPLPVYRIFFNSKHSRTPVHASVVVDHTVLIPPSSDSTLEILEEILDAPSPRGPDVVESSVPVLDPAGDVPNATPPPPASPSFPTLSSPILPPPVVLPQSSPVPSPRVSPSAAPAPTVVDTPPPVSRPLTPLTPLQPSTPRPLRRTLLLDCVLVARPPSGWRITISSPPDVSTSHASGSCSSSRPHRPRPQKSMKSSGKGRKVSITLEQAKQHPACVADLVLDLSGVSAAPTYPPYQGIPRAPVGDRIVALDGDDCRQRCVFSFFPDYPFLICFFQDHFSFSPSPSNAATSSASRVRPPFVYDASGS